MKAGLPMLAALLLGAGAALGQQGPELVQSLPEFHQPESCAVAGGRGGQTLWVTNCASAHFGDRVGFVAGKGSISRVAIEGNGKIKVVNRTFMDGLNGPLGIAVIGRGTVIYGPGTLFVNVGSALTTDAKGNPVKDGTRLGTGVLTINHETASVINTLDLGVGSTMEKILGHPVLLPNGLAFDGDSNLYVTDSGLGGDRLEPKVQPHPGVLRIDWQDLETMNQDGITFLPVPGVPNGITFNPADDCLYVVTMGEKGGEGGALYKIPTRDFKKAKLPAPAVTDLGPMDGVAVTPAGTVIVSRIKSGDLVAIRPGRKPEPLKLALKMSAPSDIKIQGGDGGGSYLFVPEQQAGAATSWSQSVHVIRLPKGF